MVVLSAGTYPVSYVSSRKCGAGEMVEWWTSNIPCRRAAAKREGGQTGGWVEVMG